MTSASSRLLPQSGSDTDAPWGEGPGLVTVSFPPPQLLLGPMTAAELREAIVHPCTPSMTVLTGAHGSIDPDARTPTAGLAH